MSQSAPIYPLSGEEDSPLGEWSTSETHQVYLVC